MTFIVITYVLLLLIIDVPFYPLWYVHSRIQESDINF